MRGMVAGLGVVVVATGGLMAAPAASAGAAVKCPVGTWKAVGYSFKVSGGSGAKGKGLGGTRLKIDGSGGLTYDFNRSKPSFSSWIDGGERREARQTLRKVLKVRAKISGSGSGSIVGRPGTATGTAVASPRMTKPKPRNLPRVSVVKQVRSGLASYLITGKFTCSKTTLKITSRQADHGVEASGTWIYRRP